MEKISQSMEKKLVEKLHEIGGNHWKKYEKNRIYFNGDALLKALGYEWSQYNSGNLSSAHLKGNHISNSQMKRVFRDMDRKFYYDLDSDTIVYSKNTQTCVLDDAGDFVREIINEIKKQE